MTLRTFNRPRDFLESLNQRIRTLCKTEGADYQLIRRQIAFDRLLTRLSHHRHRRWVLKGGHAMEIHYERARGTRDIDIIARIDGERSEIQDGDSLSRTFRVDLAVEIADYFNFRVAPGWRPLSHVPGIGIRETVSVIVADKPFDHFHIDLTIGDTLIQPLIEVESQDWLGFCGIKPLRLYTLSKEQHIAEKLHAYTQPRDGPNTRVKDLVDLILLTRDPSVNDERLRSALERLFDQRRSHPLPTSLSPPPREWKTPFGELAEECGLTLSVEEAFKEVAGFYSSTLEGLNVS